MWFLTFIHVHRKYAYIHDQEYNIKQNKQKKTGPKEIVWKTTQQHNSYLTDWGGPTKQKCYIASQCKSMAMSDEKEKHNIDTMATLPSKQINNGSTITNATLHKLPV